MLDTTYISNLIDKIDPTNLHAFELSLKTISQIKRQRHEEKLQDYLNIGRVLSELCMLFLSNRKYGEYIKAEFPRADVICSSLRTHCKWLYEALHVAGAEGSDILEILCIPDMADYYSANPTVIQRDYWNAQKANGIFRSKTPKVTESNPSADAVSGYEESATTHSCTFSSSIDRPRKPTPEKAPHEVR